MATCTVCELHAESTFKIEGMDCHEEVAILERRLKRLSGLEALDADVLGQRLRIKYDAAKLSAARSRRPSRRPACARGSSTRSRRRSRPRPRRASASFSCPARRSPVGLYAEHVAHAPAAVVWIPFVLSIALGGLYTVRRAAVSVRAGVLDINVLMLVAVAGAMLLGEWSEAASVVFLFALAQLLEARAMERARGAIRALMDLAPAEALVRRDGRELPRAGRRRRGRRHRAGPARAKRFRSTAASPRGTATSTRRR